MGDVCMLCACCVHVVCMYARYVYVSMDDVFRQHLDDHARVHHIADGLGHLDTLLIKHKAVREHSLVRCGPGCCYTCQQTALKPACTSTKRLSHCLTPNRVIYSFCRSIDGMGGEASLNKGVAETVLWT